MESTSSVERLILLFGNLSRWPIDEDRIDTSGQSQPYCLTLDYCEHVEDTASQRANQ